MISVENVQERWLDCQLDQGMFSDELAVTYPPEGAARSSVFVSRDVVRGIPGSKGKVRVTILKQSGKTLALLPTTERTIVTVEDRDITEVP